MLDKVADYEAPMMEYTIVVSIFQYPFINPHINLIIL